LDVRGGTRLTRHGRGGIEKPPIQAHPNSN
jgi:hypothetical protein